MGFAAVTNLLILVHGTNLLRPDQYVKHRLSPDGCQCLGTVEQLSEPQLTEWQIDFLLAPAPEVRIASCMSHHMFAPV